MDGPSMNWKFYTDLARERKTQELPELRQLKSHGNGLNCYGNSLNCHGKVMELYFQISVGTLHTSIPTSSFLPHPTSSQHQSYKTRPMKEHDFYFVCEPHFLICSLQSAQIQRSVSTYQRRVTNQPIQCLGQQ